MTEETLSKEMNIESLYEILNKLSTQQESICLMLNEIVTVLNQESEGSLIDELSELFAPLFNDVNAIKSHLGLNSQNDSEVQTQ
ncbi:hypothetical protein PCI56_06325 [Plesiomonas shigelloides subsp. oncorhynchi]|nr:hypothetical protein [Plesiomonas shigelloides]MDA1379235.1 hypothetical protein [Plesiomonas shigelloides]MDA1379553.1 hypothetical protein [Plesiomonas shigelloides]